MSLVFGTSSCGDSSSDDSIIYVESIEVKGDDLTLSPTRLMSATVLPSNALDKSLTWSSSDPTIATVSASGLVTALQNGTVTITATANDRGKVSGSKSITISVFGRFVESVEVQGEDITLSATSQLTAVVLPATALDKSVTWSSSDPNIATVSSTGLVTAYKDGQVTITATAKDRNTVSGSKVITVSFFNSLVQSVEVQGENLSSSNTGQMTAIVLPTTALDKSVSWSSSDTDIATVSSTGLVTAFKNGQVTITATANDQGIVSGSKTILVTYFSNDTRRIEVSTPSELSAAISNARPGDEIVLIADHFAMTSRLNLNASGEITNPIALIADNQNGRPQLDFSAMSESSSNQGMILKGDYWRIKGIDLYKAGDNGLKIEGGSHNLIEFCTFSECADSGLQIDNGATYNTILNCDSYYNADSSVENADGFACKLSAGTGNKFIGCRAWQNLDDGWDGYLRGADNITTTYENCWAIRNGILKSGVVGGGDGNGFKTGGSDDKQLKHHGIYTNCLAVENVVDGFDHNSNRGTITMYNCAAYGNGKNINFSNSNPAEMLIIKNSASLGEFGATNATAKDIINNGWQDGLSTTSSDFQSLDVEQLLAPRKADGSLPDITFMHLKSDSDLIDKGVDVGLPFNGAAPDIGAFESVN